MNTKLRNCLVGGLVAVVAVGGIWAVKSRARQQASQAAIDHRVASVARFVNNPTQLRQVVTTQQHLRDGQTVSEDEVATLIAVINGPPDSILQARAFVALRSAYDQQQLSSTQKAKAVDATLSALHSSKWLVRVFACGMLGAWKEEQTVPQILPLLNDPEKSVRDEAHKALTRLGYKTQTP